MTEDDKHAGDGQRDERERDEDEGSGATSQKGPAALGKTIGAADAFHKGCDHAGGSGDRDQQSRDKGVGGVGVVGRGIEVALKKRQDVGWENAIEEGAELRADGKGVRQKRNHRRSDNHRRKERDHGGVGGRLGEVETVVVYRAKNRTLEDDRDAEESSHLPVRIQAGGEKG